MIFVILGFILLVSSGGISYLGYLGVFRRRPRLENIMCVLGITAAGASAFFFALAAIKVRYS